MPRQCARFSSPLSQDEEHLAAPPPDSAARWTTGPWERGPGGARWGRGPSRRRAIETGPAAHGGGGRPPRPTPRATTNSMAAPLCHGSAAPLIPPSQPPWPPPFASGARAPGDPHHHRLRFLLCRSSTSSPGVRVWACEGGDGDEVGERKVMNLNRSASATKNLRNLTHRRWRRKLASRSCSGRRKRRTWRRMGDGVDWIRTRDGDWRNFSVMHRVDKKRHRFCELEMVQHLMRRRHLMGSKHEPALILDRAESYSTRYQV
jgi:hypothetical protein